ncbi:EMC6 family protein [Aspergillus undulatus]|uniref:EMC6 family protein n=1 Tax=Aspergillus undulatus TaxID=1810928 RepID=UPI003CCDEE20
MPPTNQELSLLVNPLVPESVQHNNRVRSSPHPNPNPTHQLANQFPDKTQVLTQLHSLTSFLLGLTAGILALQSATGFAFYFLGTVLVSGLFHVALLYRSGGKGAGGFYPGAGGEIEGLVVRRDGVVLDAGSGARKNAWRDVWFGGGVLGEALSGFVLGWAGVGGVLR